MTARLGMDWPKPVNRNRLQGDFIIGVNSREYGPGGAVRGRGVLTQTVNVAWSRPLTFDNEWATGALLPQKAWTQTVTRVALFCNSYVAFVPLCKFNRCLARERTSST